MQRRGAHGAAEIAAGLHLLAPELLKLVHLAGGLIYVKPLVTRQLPLQLKSAHY